ncbi:MAG TPA: FG-GAP-like repeat-containing protein [Pyrinomonadaceae bacterium]
MAVADFNADGHLDLAVSPNNLDSEVIILFGRGGSDKFGPPTGFPAGALPRRMATGDFNGDGKPDLAVSLSSIGESIRKLSILLNDGTGKFGAPTLISLAGDPAQPVLADLNNDGKLDITVGLSTGTTDGRVAVLLGNGAGGFSQAPNSPFSTFSSGVHELVIGDFNEDGKPDLAVPNSAGEADILPGDGAGGFTVGPPPPVTGGFSSLAAGDFNKDGHLDVLLGNRMFLGTGTGSFGAPIVVGMPTNSSAKLEGDVNQDGHLDVVAAGQSGLTILLGNGTGNLVQGKSYTSGFTLFGAGNPALLGDFNEDGKIDLAAVQPKGIGILDGDGTGAFNDALSYTTTIPNPRYLVAADFNNDGKQDFVTASGAFLPQGSTIEVAHGDGNGGFTKKSISNFGVSSPFAIATADFNNDGKLDLAVTQPLTGKVSFLLNDGTGGFQTDALNAPSVFFGAQPAAITAGDFNNDNKADLIVLGRNTSNFLVLLGTGTGAFAPTFNGPLQGSSGFSDDLAVGDFNSDGKSDLAVIRSSANVIHVLQGDGTGNFSDYTIVSLPGLPGSIVVRDLNGDSKPDIAVSVGIIENNIRRTDVVVFIKDGASGFNPGTSYPTESAGVLGIGDFNGDNHPDLAASTGLDGLAVLTNKGNGEFNAPVYFAVGSTLSHLAVADFNNDGKVDTLLSQSGGNAIGLALNNFSFPQPCLSVNDVTVTENDSGTVDATFTVTLSSPTEQFIKVNYFVMALGSGPNAPPAMKGVDFENVSGELIFPPTTTTRTITIPVKGDLTDEFDQFFNVVLTTPVHAAISDGKGLGTIIDNDAPATITINDISVPEGTGFPTQAPANFTVSLNAPSEKPITVQYALEAGTATSGVDYSNVSGTVEFPAGTTSKTINVPITFENTFEPDETFFVNLSNPTNATLADGVGQGTIINDDPQPSITIGTSFRTEGALGTSGNALFEVRLSNPSSQTITVAFSTANGTATAGSDYVATSGTVTFNPGEGVKSVAVEVLGDNVDEISETFLVNLSNPTNATITTAQGTGTIQDDDGPTLTLSDASVTEGNIGLKNMVFTVTLSAPTVQDVFVSYGTAAGTATPGVDFSQVFSQSLFIPAGSTSGTFNIRILGDFNIEPDEQFTVNLQFPSNATIADGQGTGTIINDDAHGKLQFSSETFSATEDAGGVVVTVNRVDGATDAVTVDFATSNGTAIAGSDYPETTGTLTLNPGETSKSFFITFVKDNVLEPDETLTVTLSNVTGGATLGSPTTATLTIKAPQLFLALEEAGLDPNQVAALDSIWLMRDPFPVINTVELLFPQGSDKNTRVVVFVMNLQLAPGDTASTVRVNLVGSNGQTYDLGAEDVRPAPIAGFSQVTFRLPDNLAPGTCNIKIKVHDQESNQGNIRIQN